jgi:chemotaxis protein methyltransferase CheR
MAARMMVDDSRGAVASAGGWSLGDGDFAFLSDFVYKHCGIVLGEHKRQLVQGRLLRRLRALGLDGFDAYVDLLRTDPDSELGELASAISTNVTAFFREMHHYDLLVDELLPRWLEAKRNGGRLRIWSAGCSSGEEPYALAMVLAEALERTGSKVDARILATDLSPQALEAARARIRWSVWAASARRVAIAGSCAAKALTKAWPACIRGCASWSPSSRSTCCTNGRCAVRSTPFFAATW